MLEGNVLKVDETATIGDEITVVVKSLVSGKTSEFTLTVTKLRQTAELTERKTIDLDLSVENGALKASDSVLLDLSEGSEYIGNDRIVVKYGEAVLYDGKGANEVTLSAEDLKGVFGEKKFVVTVYGTEVDYELSLPVNIISKTIKTKTDLDGWQEIASYVAVEANLCPAAAFRQFMTGYFVLGADISYNATFAPFTPFSTYWSLGNQGVNGVKYGDGEWNHGTFYGFKGVFDGRGYNIDGMSVSGDLSGFIVTLAGGTVKNVSFTNAGVSGSSSLVVKAGIGTIENVYVQYNSITNATETGTFFSSGSNKERNVKNCIIDVTACKFESNTKVMLIGTDADHGEDEVVYDGVYVVGAYSSPITLKDQKADCCAIGAFGTYAELLADETAAAKIAAFDTSVWAKNDNIVTFKRLFEADNVTPTITNDESEILNGVSVKLTSNVKYVRYSLDGEIEGVSVSGNVLSVGENVAEETQITVVATSLVNGKAAYFTFTVKSAGSLYIIGTEIDMTEENVTVPADAGLGGLWPMSAQFITEENGEYVAGGKGCEIRFSQNEVNAAGMITLNSPIIVKDGMNYIRVRMYVKTSSAETATIRWNKSNNGTHYEGNKDITIKANEWVNTYLAVSYFAVDGKIDGIKLGYVGQSISGIYVDDIAIVTENYSLGEEIDMTSENVNTSALSMGGMWDMSAAFIASGAEGYIDGGSGNELKLTLNNGNYNSGITLNLANPITVKEQMKYIRMRVYVKSSLSEVTLHFDNVNVTTNDNYWNKPANQATVATNQWVNIYLGIGEYMNDGKFSSIKILNRTIEGISGTEYYIDDITIVDIAGTKATLNGGTVSYPAGIPGNPFGCTDSTATTITSDSWEIAGGSDYCNAMITFATPLKITTEKKIFVRFRMSKAMNSGYIAFFNVNKEHKASYEDGYPVDDYVTVTLTLSDFATDGELKGLSIGLWGSASNVTVYLDYISIA